MLLAGGEGAAADRNGFSMTQEQGGGGHRGVTPLSDSLSLRCLWSQGDGPSAASTGQLRARGVRTPLGVGRAAGRAQSGSFQEVGRSEGSRSARAGRVQSRGVKILVECL